MFNQDYPTTYVLTDSLHTHAVIIISFSFDEESLVTCIETGADNFVTVRQAIAKICVGDVDRQRFALSPEAD